ncbi:Major facilitator superfamily [Cynara cardunculus var. scolymus]|uniref:Major facilitator superfamily n=1 Tax=Cynara cardunculus var. scolymus TaxID=59895 RepID=A0A118K307_CYNCS|nr:Major facilitator superfamily [Cynara cardunculus var. scolymus]
MTEKTVVSSGLGHLFMTVFVFNFANFMVVPAITDVSMAALCPGEDECSLAIYLTGIQQAITGMGSLVMMPLIGNLSDHYGRKVMLTVPMLLATLPLVILAYSRERNFFYAYYVLKTLVSMICEGSADNVAVGRRGSAFGILSGISSCSFVFGNLSTRFLPSAASVFQVSAAVSMVSVVYMRIFLPESSMESAVIAVSSKEQTVNESLLEKGCTDNRRPLRTTPSLHDSISLLRSSWTFSQAAIVAFFGSLGELGLYSALLYYLKAEFHFDKDQFADLMIINGIAGIISQMVLMPLLSKVVNEEKILAIGLIFNCVHEVDTFQLRSIVSKQVGPTEQGKAQGCITGLCSFASIVSPLIFSPLTALFLSDNAPFAFPGFSLVCAAFAMMIAFIQSVMIRAPPPPVPDSKLDDSVSVEP